jgi:hypothetical protein
LDAQKNKYQLKKYNFAILFSYSFFFLSFYEKTRT